MVQTKKQNPDLEPLLEVSTNESRNFKKPSTWNSTSKPLLIKRGIISNKRQAHQASEKCGRIRLVVVATAIFMSIYFFNVTFRDSNFIVQLPVDDDDWPGTKDIDTINNLKNLLNISSTTTQQLNDEILSTTMNYSTSTAKSPIVPAGYLVFGPGCKMPDFDPWAKNVMKLFHKEKYGECMSKKPLTRIIRDYTTGEAVLYYDESIRKRSYHKTTSCCYQNITRDGSEAKADDKFKLSKCVPLVKPIQLPSDTEHILVKCKEGERKGYTNAHTMIRRKKEINDRIDNNNARFSKRPLSVLMLGIDSISRLNLIRAMPHTAQHLYQNNWFELRGYNKIDDNTYPNLMAIFTGYNNTLAYEKCSPTTVGKLDECPFMWKYFKDNGYVTAYAEDEVSISTFNYHKVGFQKQPTDYYPRPFFLAAEKNLVIQKKSSLTFCLGFKHYADYIYEHGLDFATTYKNESFFGFFWANTFSHNAISDPSSMDIKIKSYLERLETQGILNTSAVVFLSDHGIRFGPVRQLETGWLEERLPFIFIWLPQWFRDEYPDLVTNLKINRNRLTNPYDLHMTLKHILELSGRIESLPLASSCPACQSLFHEVPYNRSCDEIAIAAHWCTCTAFGDIDKNAPIVKSAVKFVIDYMNDDLKRHENATRPICAQLRLGEIHFARKGSFKNHEGPYDDYIISFETLPGEGIFESTLRYHSKTKKFEMTGSVSRLNKYDTQSICMHIDYLKKYCFCLPNSSNAGKKR